MIYNYKTIDLEVKDVDKKEGIITGYFAAFNIKDADGDIIQPGAFTKSVGDMFPKGRIKHLMNHDPSKPLGKLMELKEDEYGLRYVSKIGTHSLGRDFIKMVESDLIKEHSIGFNDLTPESKRKGEDANYITEVKLYEGSSLTAWGANEFTPLVEMKGGKEELAERIIKFEKFVRNTDATDETIELCLIQIKQLSQIIETMSTTSAVDEALKPGKESKEDVNETIIHSLNSLSNWKISIKS
jgi:HK97 family phage prohead protease